MAEEHDEKKTHEVKDKRRVNPDGTLREDAETSAPERAQPKETGSDTQKAQESAQPGESQEQPPRSEQPETPGETGEAPAPDVYNLLRFVFGLMADQAWQLMGIRLAPGQKEPVKDMVQAKLAIDTAVFISDKLQLHVSEDERRVLRATISDLQMNYVART